MKTSFRAVLTAVALVLTAPAWAANRTVTLSVENASCVTCGPIVKRTLSKLPGVIQVVIGEKAGTATATVNFDDQRVTPEALTAAVSNAGYPAHVREN